MDVSDGVENGCENYASNVVIGSLSEPFFREKEGIVPARSWEKKKVAWIMMEEFR